MSDIDNFYLDKMYPNPDKIFGFEYKSIQEIKDSSIYVLDTNVLLVPFDASEKNIDEIKNIFLKLKNQKKLFIPARVAREFANNRATKIGKLFLKIRQSKENLNTGYYKKEIYPLLQSNNSYNKVLENYDKITELIKETRKELAKVENDILSWNWNDYVSRIYKEIFTPDIIVEVKKKKEDLIKDLKYRITHKIAPGYKDSGKLDDGIGDLIVWQTSIELAKENNLNLILVSNDKKNDWFYKQDKIGLYPKYELFDEFRKFTDGLSMQIIDFPQFLELQNATPETVHEIKQTIEIFEESKYSKNHEVSSLIEGLRIDHKKFGLGTVKSIYKSANNREWFEVDFDDYGTKKLLIGFTPMRIVKSEYNSRLLNGELV